MQLFELYQNDLSKLYDGLNTLFKDFADFTPGKQIEYASEPHLDKYCRFNLENNNVNHPNALTSNIFLLDDTNKIMGTISATIIMHSDNKIDIYVYDEIAHLENIKEEEKEIKRQAILGQLFSA